MTPFLPPTPPTIPGRWRARIAQLWHHLTEPHPSITKEPERRRARMLSALLLALIFSALLGLMAIFLPGGTLLHALMLLVMIVGLSATYWLSRSRYYNRATLLMISVLFVSLIGGVALTKNAGPADFLILVILIANLFLSLRLTTLLLLITLSVLVSLPAFIAGLSASEFINTLFLIGVTGIVAVVIAVVRRQDWRQIEAQAGALKLEIEERNQANEALRLSEARYRGFLNAAPDAMVVVNQQGEIAEVNAQVERLFGYAQNELLGKPIETLMPERLRQIHPGHRVGFIAAPRTHEMGADQELYALRKDGSEFPVEVSLSHQQIRDEVIVISTIRDITERKQTEETLRESEMVSRIIASSSPDVIFIQDRNLQYERIINPAPPLLPEQVIGKTDWDLLPLEEARRLIELKEQVLATGVPVREEVLVSPGGVPHWYDAYYQSAYDDTGHVIGLISYSRDITERKRAEEALRESEERFGNAFEYAAIGMALVAPEGRWLRVNESVCSLLGYSKEELMLKTFQDITHPDDLPADLEYVRQMLAGEIRTYRMEKRYIHKLGHSVSVFLSVSLVRDRQNQPLYFISQIEDITLRKQAEQEIRQQTARAEALVRTAARLNAELELDAVLQAVCEETARALAVPAVAITLVDPASQTISVVADCGLPPVYRQRQKPIPLAAFAAVANQDRVAPIMILDVQAIPGLPDADLHRAINSRTIVGASLMSKGAIIGGLNVLTFSEVRHFGDDELALLQGLADQAAQAIANAQLYSEQVQTKKALRQLNAELEQWVAARAAELSRFFTLSLDLLAIAGVDGYFKRLNPAWQSVLGYSEAELMDRPFVEFVHPDDQANTLAEAGKLAGGEYVTINFENRYRHRNGEYRWILWNSSAADGLIYAVARDITDAKQFELELLQAKDGAEQANRAKSEFLSRMSHELRTPLNSIFGFAQLLEMNDLEPSSEKGVKHILKSGRHLLDLINEVLDISRIESGQLALSPEPVQLRGVILEMLDNVYPLAEERRLTLELTDSAANDLFVTADRQLLKQVLLNLLSNAVKYNREGGSVIVDCRLQIADTDSHSSLGNPPSPIRVSVSDTGTGIAAENLARLFNPFERIGAERTETEGTGLGLVIAKKLIEAMGGTLRVDSVLGQGSTFSVELPAAEDPHTNKKQTGALRALVADSAKTGTVLYIEDNLPNLQLVEQIFAKRPQIKLITAMQGRLGWELARQHIPDLILLDLNLPDIQGAEVLRLLGAEPKTRAIPVVVISADATAHQIKRLLEAGAQDYLTKPLDVKKFLALIDEMLRAH